MRRLTCLVCPSGCQLLLDGEAVTGFRCPRGEKYAREEALTPRRTVTTTLSVDGGRLRLPVKTQEKVPLERIPALLEALAKVRVKPPVQLGEIVAQLPEAVVATRTLPLLSILLLLFAPPAQAWARHDLITRQALASMVFLDRYENIPVTAYEAEDKDPYTPEWEPKFLEKKVGDKTTAREILIRYADEPDWKMDEVPGLSPFQNWMGGGQGFRHQRYFLGFLRLGDAPNRAEHFWGLSKAAFARGNSYWGFRYFARALHYLEDMAEPLHTQPATFGQLQKLGFKPKKVTNYATNLHYAYEHYVSKHMGRRDPSGERFVAALCESGSPEIGLKDGAIALSEYAHSKAGKLLEANDAYWPKRVKSKSKKVLPNDQEVFAPRSEAQLKMDDLTVDCFRALGRVIRGSVEVLRKEVLEKPPAEEE